MSSAARRWTVAAVQMTSTEDRERNLRQAMRLARQAAERGADLVALPENFSYLRPEGKPLAYADRLDGELVQRLTALARELSCHLLAGSIPEKVPRSRRVHNTSLLFDPRGRVLARYRKLHLFDIEIAGQVSFRESRTVAPGEAAVSVQTALGRLGMSICYDLRFPELYRRLAFQGAQVIFVPAAFTAYTGRFHWLTLLRARAIENTCWIVAPAQVGRHAPGRHSYGHTVVYDPWGETAGLRERGPGLVLAEIDLDRVDEVRKGLPVLDHVRRELFGPLPRRRRR